MHLSSTRHRTRILAAGCAVLMLATAPALAQSSGGSSGGSSSGSAGSTGSAGGIGGGSGGAPGAPTGSTSIGGATSVGPSSDTSGTVLPNGTPAPGGGQAGTLGDQGTSAANNPGVPSTNPGTPGVTGTVGTQPGGVSSGAAADAPNSSGPGIAGSPAEIGSRGGSPACADVLAHRDYFTAKVIQGCEQQARRQGKDPALIPDQRRTADGTGSLGAGIKPVDRPSEVQKQKEMMDQKVLKGICTNC